MALPFPQVPGHPKSSAASGSSALFKLLCINRHQLPHPALMWDLLPHSGKPKKLMALDPQCLTECEQESLLTFHSHLLPSLPLPAFAELWQGAPELGPAPPLPAGYGDSKTPLQPQPGGSRGRYSAYAGLAVQVGQLRSAIGSAAAHRRPKQTQDALATLPEASSTLSSATLPAQQPSCRFLTVSLHCSDSESHTH